MATELTEAARRASESRQVQPNLVFDIDGISTMYGAIPILRYIRIGDPDLLIGPDWVIGGKVVVPGSKSRITFDGTSSSIDQKLDIDKASGASVSQMDMALVDVNSEITELITPGQIVDDILGRRAAVWLGFGGTAWPEDYIRILRGTIDKVNSVPGKITFTLSHPDKKKKQTIFFRSESQLNGSIISGDTTITLDNAAPFLTRVLGPDGLYDSSINYGVLIDNEVIFYTGISGNQLTGCVRGSLGTTPASHADEASVVSFYQLTGNSMDLALKVMLSRNDYYEANVDVTNFNILGDGDNVANSIFFSLLDVADEYGVVPGDYITTSGATNGANNVTLKQVLEVVKTDEGSYITVDGVTFVDELASAAVISFRSQYDTLNPSCGMALHNNEVDILEHEKIKRWFLSSFDYDFYIRDTIENGKEWLEKEIYFPASAYAIPRKTRSSVAYHIGPLPTSDIRSYDQSNVIKPSGLSIKRSSDNYLYNTIVYRYEEKLLEADKFLRGYVTVDNTSKNQIQVGTKALVIDSRGMREILSGQVLAQNAANRRLKRYKFAAEFIENFQVTFGSSFNVDIGDIILVDMADLKISDTKNATRSGKPRLFEILNKRFDVRTGKINLTVLDTGYSTTSRYCLMSPSSRLAAGCTSTVLKLKVTGNSIFGVNEGAKWSRYPQVSVRVRSDDFVARNDTSNILSVSGNTVILDSALSFTPSEDDTLTIDHYNAHTGEVGDKIHLIYGFQENTVFDDTTIPYQLI